MRPDTTLRSLEEVCEKARAILMNVKELREVAKGDEGVFKTGIDLLGMLDGKSLPPGWFVRVLADIKKLSVDELKNVRPGCGVLRLHRISSRSTTISTAGTPCTSRTATTSK